MKEGEPILGGPQANPGVSSMPSPGTQPANPSATQNPLVPTTPPAQNPIVSSPQSFSPQLSRRPHFAPTLATQPISSSTEDIVLSAPKPKKSRKWLFILAPCLILAIVVIAALFINKPFNSATKENYEEAVNTLIEQASIASSVNELLEKGLDGKIYPSDFFSKYTIDAVDGRLKSLNDIGGPIEELQKNNFSNDVKSSLKDLSGQAEEYKTLTSNILNKIKTIVSSVDNLDTVGIESFVVENNLSTDTREELMSYYSAYTAAKPNLEKCNNDSAECDFSAFLGYENQVDENKGLVAAIFNAIVREDELEFLLQFRDNVDEVRNTLENQNRLNEGDSYEN